jgi:hypothetical protein
MEFIFVNTVDDVLDIALIKKVLKKAPAARPQKKAAARAAQPAKKKKRAD